mmetsp:Transcript_14351/g.33978  ORF Transcript_14351/g.33978 Transcript_14351/m.33978 type:complete len:287 (+) Transcript_14351:63-923(+)
MFYEKSCRLNGATLQFFCFIAAFPPVLAVDFYTYEVVKTYPHDKYAFTQGLVYEHLCNRKTTFSEWVCSDVFWESTGIYGSSTVRLVDLQTGNVLRAAQLERKHFGEGLVKDPSGQLVQLLWRTGRTLVFDPETLKQVGERHTGLTDGWGLATDGRVLYATDSTDVLHTIDPQTHKVTGTRPITWRGRRVKWVNEMEYIEGELWGNVWHTECIARIDPETAEVNSWVLMDGLSASTRQANQVPRMDVLNGAKDCLMPLPPSIPWPARSRAPGFPSHPSSHNCLSSG